MPPCMGMGEAAGVAAAIAVHDNVDVRNLNVEKLRNKLIDNNVLLNV